jgi:cysteinyl-tRNA synthetase
MDWTVSALEFAESRFIEWADLERDLQKHIQPTSDNFHEQAVDPQLLEALLDDLNTPLALTRLYELGEAADEDFKSARSFLAGRQLLGIQSWAPDPDKLRALAREVEPLIEARNAARKAKNFAESDRIRDELAAMGIKLHDSKDPETGEPVTTWEVQW